MTRKLLLAVLVAAAVASAVVARSGTAHAQSGSCIATYTFDSFTILQDADDGNVYPGPDRWTVHTYARLHTDSGGWVIGNGSEVNFGVLKGVAGDTIGVGWPEFDHRVIGEAGEDVTVEMRPGKNANRVKEVDRTTVKRVTAKDVNVFGVAPDVIVGCQPGTYHYSTQDDIPDTADGGAGENDDAVVQLDFTLVLENG